MLSVLLMVRINYHHRVIMAKRRIPALDGYMDRINLLLWPRFKARPPCPIPCCPAQVASGQAVWTEHVPLGAGPV